jgi:hypothetical protein
MQDERRVINDLIESTIRKGHKNGFEALNDPQRVVFLIGEFATMMVMVGMADFYLALGGALADPVVASLERIGALNMAALIRWGNSLFPGGRPDPNPEILLQDVNSLSEEVRHHLNEIEIDFDAHPDDLGAKLEAFVLTHRAELER